MDDLFRHIDEFCTHCGTSPCTHPDNGLNLAIAQADRNGRWAAIASLAAILFMFLTMLCATGVI